MAHRRFRVATQGAAAAHDKVATRHCECCVRNARVRDDDSSKGRPPTSYLPMRHSSAVRLRRSPQSLIYACTMGALTAVVLACDHNASTCRPMHKSRWCIAAADYDSLHHHKRW